MSGKISVLFIVCYFVYVRGNISIPQKIAGGDVTTISEYPFAAALLTNRGSGPYMQSCGGTVLTANAILSAASCFYTEGVVNPVHWWRARVGSTNSNSGGTIYIVNRFTIHEEFNPTTLVNDIAVLRTNLNINFQTNVTEVARIAGAGYTLQNNQVVHAIGWGVTSENNPSLSEQLRVVQVWLINQQTCINRYSDPWDDLRSDFTVTDTMLCSGFLDVGVRGQCAGDVGGPLLDNNKVVIGVFSRTTGCADDWYPDINTRVPSFSRWIVAAAVA